MTDGIAAARAKDIGAVRALFLEYADSLDFSLCFQGFDEELATLPGAYTPPSGGLWLAWLDGAPVGVVAMRPLDEDGACELKRLYVRPAARGHGIGVALTRKALDAARAGGHRLVRLDTVGAQMRRAVAIYQAFGFRETPPYYAAAVDGLTCYALDLAEHG